MVPHSALSGSQLDAMRELFDREYLAEHGEWHPDQPYGYSPASVHTLAYAGSALVGHVGFQVRTIGVGETEVTVAGTGGVLVDDLARGTGLGRRLMRRAQEVMCEDIVRRSAPHLPDSRKRLAERRHRPARHALVI